MVFRKQVFDKEGKCPQGYEYVNSYSANGIYHSSYCRRIPRYRRHDPEERIRMQEKKEEEKSLQRAEKIFWNSEEDQ